MPRVRKSNEEENENNEPNSIRPAINPEARENQLIYLATKLAEKQLLEGTASSQVITHYLKLGSSKEKLEKEILEKQKDLITAKTDAIQSAKNVEALYKEAVEAMRSYSGTYNSEGEEPEEDD